MEDLDEKAVVRVNSDGEVTKCAKGAGPDCGYKPGAKVCGKCGAMPVEIKKGAPEEEMLDDEDLMEEEVIDKDMLPEDEEEYDDEMVEGAAKKGTPKRVVAMRNPDGLDEDETPDPDAEEMDASDEAPDESNAEMGETPMEAMGDADRKRRMAARARRMASMNVKSADWDDDAYLCGFESKMLAGSTNPCAACPGGCAPEADLPTLIEVQGLAEEVIGGKVLDSGYADSKDLFVVDVQRKDGRVAEAIFDGTTAECLGWTLLDDDLVGTKSLAQNFEVISIDDAIQIVTKSLPGNVVGVDADVFEGYDVYAVEIEGLDGKSYDGFVSLDGELLGYDEYSADEASTIEADVAEHAMKVLYSESERMSMAKTGEALEDGAFPIRNVDDLKNAISAYGRAKDKAAAKLHIMKRATELEAEDMIPGSWSETEDEGTKSLLGSEDAVFLATLMEFEMLAVEEDLD